MNQDSANNEFRVLARETAETLSDREIDAVSGAGCTETAKVTYSQKTGNDVEVSVSCTA